MMSNFGFFDSILLPFQEFFSISTHSNIFLHPRSVCGKMLSSLLRKSYATARTKVTADC